MKKLVVFALLCTMSLSIVGCSGNMDKKEEPKKVEKEASTKDKTEKDDKSEVKNSIKMKIDGVEMSYPQDFSYDKMTGNGISTNTPSTPFLASYGEDGSVKVKYSNGVYTIYHPDAYLVPSIDSMYMTGMTYTGSDIEILGGIDLENPDEMSTDSEKLYSNESFMLSIKYDEDGKIEGAVISANTEDNFYRADETEKTEDITEFVVTDSVFNDDGTIDYVVDSEILAYPSDMMSQNRMMPYVPFEYGFTNDIPNYVLQNKDEKQEIIGIVLNNDEVNTGLTDVKIGDNFYDALEKLGVKDKPDTDIVKLVPDNGDPLSVYLQNDGNTLKQVTIVTEER